MAGLGLMNRRRAIASSPTKYDIMEDTILPYLVLRYSANSVSNESLLADGKIPDLTGNGYDLMTYGFTADGTNGVMVDEDGEQFIRFTQSPHCYAKTISLPAITIGELQDYTLIAKRKWVSRGGYDAIFNIYGNASDKRLCLFENCANSDMVTYSVGSYSSAVFITGVFNAGKSIVYQTVDSYNGKKALSYKFDIPNVAVSNIRIGSSDVSSKRVFDLYDILFFRRKMTPEEISLIVNYFEL